MNVKERDIEVTCTDKDQEFTPVTISLTIKSEAALKALFVASGISAEKYCELVDGQKRSTPSRAYPFATSSAATIIRQNINGADLFKVTTPLYHALKDVISKRGL